VCCYAVLIRAWNSGEVKRGNNLVDMLVDGERTRAGSSGSGNEKVEVQECRASYVPAHIWESLSVVYYGKIFSCGVP
jgi:hypothetical protein